METEGVDYLVEVSQETLEDCWELHLEIWENAVRDNLQDKVIINIHSHKTVPREIPVEYGE
ncbi:hypothetical protein SAMN05216218_10214 [Halorientalis regularis]|uniref:Uncharacterized protein n=2 Tax=Halorientalis regularis TaxID=660518 RepID=A0A1G7GF24_9EURY|nr:hypothetical protein SAMN05216218_10214 [Halorientalis regularis]